MKSALIGKVNLYLDRFSIASKRNNSSSYSFADVFVTQFFDILSDHLSLGLTLNSFQLLVRHRLLHYYPRYAFSIRLNESKGNLQYTLSTFDSHFYSSFIYQFWVRPFFTLPKPFFYLFSFLVIPLSRLLMLDIAEVQSAMTYLRSSILPNPKSK